MRSMFRWFGVDDDHPNRGWLLVLSLTSIFGLILLILYAASATKNPGGFFGVVATGCLLAIAAAMVGAVLGFLFGLPRAAKPDATPPADPNAGGSGSSGPLAAGEAAEATAAAAEPKLPPAKVKARYGANTNLEDVSDWLTKILIGASLTQIGTLAGQFHRIVEFATPSLGGGGSGGEVAAVTIVAYSIVGFLATYLWARIRLEAAFATADAAQEAVTRRLARASAVVAITKLSGELEPVRAKVHLPPAPGPMGDAQTRTLKGLADIDSVRNKIATDPGSVADGELLATIETAQSLLKDS